MSTATVATWSGSLGPDADVTSSESPVWKAAVAHVLDGDGVQDFGF
jgi:hypothetical protein